ncbi:hypothetical protein RP726_17090 [Candidatus Methylospira mobilis]|uniref:hypothetical protein n=1 Tax=Candidatus Methylospira mobilis TaxID=1808979 RepID=UPI0028EB1C84|nr:hypothetical protein [Candidatus Methylospira mobilis]WNV06919.1 hypothetical protein RP726_17090 [Candidatus Methylospira mobilis]
MKQAIQQSGSQRWVLSKGRVPLSERQVAGYSVHSGFAEASILHAFSNCRPAFPDNLPRIYVSERLVRINGLYRHGFMLAPLIVENTLNALNGDLNSPFIQQH